MPRGVADQRGNRHCDQREEAAKSSECSECKTLPTIGVEHLSFGREEGRSLGSMHLGVVERLLVALWVIGFSRFNFSARFAGMNTAAAKPRFCRRRWSGLSAGRFSEL